MGRHLPLGRVLEIEDALLEDGYRANKKAIAFEFSTTYESVRLIWNRIRVGKGPKPLGQRRVITLEIDKAVTILLETNPTFYQDEIADFLHDTYGVEVHQSTISRCIQRVNLTRKRLRKEAQQWNGFLREC